MFDILQPLQTPTGMHTGAHGAASSLFLLELVSYTFMVLMLLSCYAFRHSFQTEIGGLGKVGRILSSWQYALNKYHHLFFWLALGFKIVQLGIGLFLGALPALTSTAGVLELFTSIIFFLWAGTCYYGRYRLEKGLFDHPPACSLPRGAGKHTGRGEPRFYRYHRYFMYLVLIHLPIYPLTMLTGSLLPGLIVFASLFSVLVSKAIMDQYSGDHATCSHCKCGTENEKDLSPQSTR